MSRRIGTGYQSHIKWTIKDAPEDDQCMIGRWLPQTDARVALVQGMYETGTVLEISGGKLQGKWKVVNSVLVSLANPEIQFGFDKHAKPYKTAQPVLMM